MCLPFLDDIPRPRPVVSPMEMCSLLLKLWWATALLWPRLPLPGTPGVLLIGHHDRDWIWAAVLTALALVHLYALLYRRARVSRDILLAATGIWTFVAARYATLGFTFGAGAFSIIALCVMVTYWRLGRVPR